MSKIALEGNASGTGTFTVAAPNSNSNYTLTLPANTGTIITSGSTTGIDASALSTGTVAKARLPAGSVLQVVSTTLTTSFTASVNNSFSSVTGLTATITPTSSSSKIMVFVTMVVGSNGNYVNTQLTRGGSTISGSLAATAGNRSVGTTAAWPVETYGMYMCTFSYLDSPATTSSTTYGVQIGNYSPATLCVNQSQEDSDSAFRTRGTSTITVMEIAA